MNSPEATKGNQQITTSWDENAIEDLEHVCPEQYHDSFLSLLSSKTNLHELTVST